MNSYLSPAQLRANASQAVLNQVRAHLIAQPPTGLTQRDVVAWFRRYEAQLLPLVDDALAQLRARRAAKAAAPAAAVDLAPELWGNKERTRANLAAMLIAATTPPSRMTAADRAALALYSGWGGLSIRAVADKFPEGFPVPDERGLIHEYYTPTKVVQEVARVLRGLVAELPHEGGRVLTLEPSAGIGRFVQAASGPGFEALQWSVVEWSELSARMLQALRPDVSVFNGPFERWVREEGPKVEGRLGLVLSNPPYGARGVSITEDPNRDYREKKAYAYFLRRALDLLAPNGLGVFLIPSGFLTGRSVPLQTLRERVLRRHHLSAAYRLPSELFPGALLVTDLLFFRARAGELSEVDPADRGIADGNYFREYPDHILGTEVGKPSDDDDQTAKPRWGYEVKGTFERLPDLVERPVCGECALHAPAASTRGAPARATGAAAQRPPVAPEGELPEELATAVALGLRVDRYLSAVARDDSDEHVRLWPELHAALTAWTKRHGNPHAMLPLRNLAEKKHVLGAERLLSAFTRPGALIPGLATQPVWTPRYAGRRGDLVALADWTHRGARALTLETLAGAALTQGEAPSIEAARKRVLDALPALVEAGWCLDGDGWDVLLPKADHLSGLLWPRHDRCKRLLGANPPDGVLISGRLWGRLPRDVIERQLRELTAAIAPAMFDDIGGVSPRAGWMPLDLVAEWMESYNVPYGRPRLTRTEGLVQVEGVDYNEVGDRASTSFDVTNMIGWINHDFTNFQPRKTSKTDNLDEIRLAIAAEWERTFQAWAGSSDVRRERIEAAYNAAFKGWVAPAYGTDPLNVARWADKVTLKPHQVAGARRVLANRGGLLAFDVGVGKTYTGIGIVSAARQEGWCRRPVILVPNSIVWKWEADVRRCLPDYRIAVIGSKKKVVSRGDRKGFETSETDTPAERGEKWARFQAGEYDVVLLTYTALSRTRMNEGAIRAYADATEAVRREVRLRQRNAEKAKKTTERQDAILKEGVSAWIAEQMELPEGWEYDPGVAWDDIGIDLLVVDEAQNFKNLYLPESREGGVPRFMGNAGEGSKRAWQLDFRCAAVRRRTKGTGVVLLSATPAKNSPLEFYNLLQLVDHDVWSRMGIRDPEQFIDRYLKIEMKQVIDTKMDTTERSAVVGFQNLHELRDVIFRYGDFKTAEDVGLVLPEPRVNLIEVDLSPAQADKYAVLVAEIERAMESTRPADKAKILGILARMSLVSIHVDLDGGYDWKRAGAAADAGDVDPRSPKFDALAARVLQNRTCGHIVFVDNIAAHRWIVETLVARGVPRARIGVLNAVVAQAAADRQRIAKEFNGDPENGIAPKFDVVIANAIAYEGIDLQTRTCAIHHIDLPWEPATLQQRNGRGVRQGNTLAAIEINYYFARKSQDGLRFNLIQGKRGWMVQLIKGSDRETNNPGAQMDLGPDEILLLISRNPEQTAARMAALREKRLAEARAKAATATASRLRSAVARFRAAERKTDPSEAQALRLEGEAILRDVQGADPEAWPWARVAHHARDHQLLVPANGKCPAVPGLRAGVPSPTNPDRVTHLEFGRVGIGTGGLAVGVRESGSPTWTVWQEHADPKTEARSYDGLNIAPADLDRPWPEDDPARTDAAIEAMLARAGSYVAPGHWTNLGWTYASDAWVTEAWARHGERILEVYRRGLTAAEYAWTRAGVTVPMVRDGKIMALASNGPPGAVAFPPTREGWEAYLRLAPASGATFTTLLNVGVWWWGRRIPQDLLSSAKES